MRSRKWSTDGACYLLGKQHFLNKYKKGLLTAKQELFFWLIHSVTFESVLFALIFWIFFYFHFWFAVITACNMTSWKVLLKTCHSGLLICFRLQNKRERSRVQIWTRSNCQNNLLFIFFSTKAICIKIDSRQWVVVIFFHVPLFLATPLFVLHEHTADNKQWSITVNTTVQKFGVIKMYLNIFYTHQSCIYLIKNIVKTLILWNIINLK